MLLLQFHCQKHLYTTVLYETCDKLVMPSTDFAPRQHNNI